MEKLIFNSNVEMAAIAKDLLTKPYQYGYCEDNHVCAYRTPDGKRCIFGRMMYGHIPEDHPFWNSPAGAEGVIGLYYDLFKTLFPWMLGDENSVVSAMQAIHDEMAFGSDIDVEARFARLEELAVQADQSYFGSK